jgi:hypothetical protein
MAASVALPASAVSPGAGATGHTGARTSVARLATPAACTSVRAELGRADGAAGSTFQTIRLRNTSTVQCRIGGFPHVGYVNRHHRLIGWPAAPSRQKHHPHVLAPGAAARTILQIPDPGNFAPIDCLAHNAHQIRVRLHGTRPSFLRWDQVECTTRFARSHVFAVRR